MANIFLTHSPMARANYYGERALEGLRLLGEVRLNQQRRELSIAEIVEAAQDCEVIVSFRQTAAPAELFDQLPNLVAFCRCAIDIRNIDVASASRHGILITQASAGFVTSVSEWVIGAMIDLGRGITAATEAYHQGQIPIPHMGRELRASTVGIIGYGQISRHLSEVCLNFGMRVLINDPYVQVEDERLTQLGFAELLAQSDFVVCLAVATEETENLMNGRAFAGMKRGALFVNASRGNLVDEAALAHALDSGHLGGCAIDVGRAPDQMPTPALARHRLIIATPHLAGLTPQAIEHQSLETVSQVAQILDGVPPTGAVNSDHATRLERFRGAADDI